MTQLTPLDLDDLRCKAQAAYEELVRAEVAAFVAKQKRIEAADAYALACRRWLQAQQDLAPLSPPGAMKLPTDMTT